MIEHGHKAHILTNKEETQFWVELEPIGYTFPTRQVFGPMDTLEKAEEAQIKLLTIAREAMSSVIERIAER